MTLATYAGGWLSQRMGRLAPNSQRAYRAALVHHVLPALGASELAALTPAIVRAWLRREAAARSPNSVKALLAALSTVLADAVLDGLVAHNAAHGASRRLLPRRSPVPKAMTPAELDAFLAATRLLGSPWAADAFRVYSRTGLRLGELLALQPRSLVADGPALRVEQTYHGGALGFGPPKGGRVRLVEVSPAIFALLVRRTDTGGALFPGPDGQKPLHPSTVECAFAQAAGIAALPGQFTVHSLRHTYASILLAAGAPPPWVQQQLGHANYAITVDLYGSWLTQRRPDLVALLDRAPTPQGIVRAERGRVIPLQRNHHR